jgi:hypothetical protein
MKRAPAKRYEVQKGYLRVNFDGIPLVIMLRVLVIAKKVRARRVRR